MTNKLPHSHKTSITPWKVPVKAVEWKESTNYRERLKRIGKTLDGGWGMMQSLIWAKWACTGSHKQGIQFHLHLELSVLLNQKPWTGGEHGSVQSTCVVRTLKNRKRLVFKNNYCCMQVTQTSLKWPCKMLLKSVTSQTQGILFSGSQVVWKNKYPFYLTKNAGCKPIKILRLFDYWL